MPAIQPARLKHQTAQLTIVFEQPDLFIKALFNLLYLYADHTQRPGQGGEPTPLLESFRVPQPVLREILFELKSSSRLNPQAALSLCQRLWAEPLLEYRWIASAMLGQISALPPQQVLQVVQEWLEIKPEDTIRQVLLDQGLIYLRQERSEFLMTAIKEWLSNPKLYLNQCGIWALYFMATDPNFHNIPEVFYLLTPFIRSAPNELRPDLLNIMHKLAHYAPQETAYVLRQNIDIFDSSDTAWIARQLIHEFPKPIQESLRESLESVK
jgi:hypothetical protein